MNFLVQFIKIAILQGACAQLLLGGIHRCGHFSRAFQMTYFFRLVLAAPGGNRAAWGMSRCGVFCGGGLYLGTFRAVSLGRYFHSEQLFLHNFIYSARSGFNPTRSLSIFSENIKIFSENIKKLVVI